MRKRTTGDKAARTRSIADLAMNEESHNLMIRFYLPAAFFMLLTILIAAGQARPAVLVLYGGMSLVTFIMYAVDKSAARRGMWRIEEANLHLLELFGGWPGALMAQRMVRHKTKKPSFQKLFWCATTANCTALALFLY